MCIAKNPGLSISFTFRNILKSLIVIILLIILKIHNLSIYLFFSLPPLQNFKEKDSGKVVLYTTSMGIIRDTYAKCSNVKKILRTLLVKFEERDVFMSVEYQQEIKERMHSEIIKVPQLFVEGQHIGVSINRIRCSCCLYFIAC